MGARLRTPGVLTHNRISLTAHGSKRTHGNSYLPHVSLTTAGERLMRREALSDIKMFNAIDYLKIAWNNGAIGMVYPR